MKYLTLLLLVFVAHQSVAETITPDFFNQQIAKNCYSLANLGPAESYSDFQLEAALSFLGQLKAQAQSELDLRKLNPDLKQTIESGQFVRKQLLQELIERYDTCIDILKNKGSRQDYRELLSKIPNSTADLVPPTREELFGDMKALTQQRDMGRYLFRTAKKAAAKLADENVRPSMRAQLALSIYFKTKLERLLPLTPLVGDSATAGSAEPLPELDDRRRLARSFYLRMSEVDSNTKSLYRLPRLTEKIANATLGVSYGSPLYGDLNRFHQILETVLPDYPWGRIGILLYMARKQINEQKADELKQKATWRMFILILSKYYNFEQLFQGGSTENALLLTVYPHLLVKRVFDRDEAQMIKDILDKDEFGWKQEKQDRRHTNNLAMGVIRYLVYLKLRDGFNPEGVDAEDAAFMEILPAFYMSETWHEIAPEAEQLAWDMMRQIVRSNWRQWDRVASTISYDSSHREIVQFAGWRLGGSASFSAKRAQEIQAELAKISEEQRATELAVFKAKVKNGETVDPHRVRTLTSLIDEGVGRYKACQNVVGSMSSSQLPTPKVKKP